MCRFAHRADEQKDGEQVCRVPISPQERNAHFRQSWHSRKDVIELNRVRQHIDAEDTKCETKVTNTVYDKRFDRCRIRRRLTVVEANQKVGCYANAFPTKEHLDQVVRSHQHQHRESKERQVSEETRLVALAIFPQRIIGHVAKRIQVY